MRRVVAAALLGLALCLVAALFDAEPLYVPGATFAALALANAAWVVAAARGVRVRRVIGSQRVLEGQPVSVEIAVSCGRLPLPAGAIEDGLLPAPAPLAPGRRRTRVSVSTRFPRRGRVLLDPPRVVVRDMLGLAVREVGGGSPGEILVLPRIEPVRAPAGEGGGSGLAARRGRPSAAAEVDLDGLRPHRPGAPAARIYWQALARGGELMERRLRADGDARPLVVVDPRAPRSREDLDAAVRAAASLCVHLARDGGCGLLLPGDRRPTALEATLAGWAHVHARLALLQERAGPSMAGLMHRSGPVLYVVAHVPAGPPAALSRVTGAARLLVVPGEMAGRRAVLRVAGCSAYELGGRHAHARTSVAGAA